MPSSPHRPLRADWRAILAAAIEANGMSWRSVSLQAGLNHSAVSEWLREGAKPRSPSFEALAKVAAVVGLSLDDFVTEEKVRNVPSYSPTVASLAKVVGIVEAGTWREPRAMDERSSPFIPFVSNPDYRGCEQFAWKIVGNSVNKLARDGDYAITVRLLELGREPKHGEFVVVERRDGDLYEYTIKQVRYTPTGPALMPYSDDPAHQAPAWTTDHASEHQEIEATHLVIGVFRPVPTVD